VVCCTYAERLGNREPAEQHDHRDEHDERLDRAEPGGVARRLGRLGGRGHPNQREKRPGRENYREQMFENDAAIDVDRHHRCEHGVAGGQQQAEQQHHRHREQHAAHDRPGRPIHPHVPGPRQPHHRLRHHDRVQRGVPGPGDQATQRQVRQGASR
jgi:hypothetical protein